MIGIEEVCLVVYPRFHRAIHVLNEDFTKLGSRHSHSPSSCRPVAFLRNFSTLGLQIFEHAKVQLRWQESELLPLINFDIFLD